jgi:hypothetical protein
MYKRRLPSFVAYLLELTTCVLALLPEKMERKRKKGRKEQEKRGTIVQYGKHRLEKYCVQSAKRLRVI